MWSRRSSRLRRSVGAPPCRPPPRRGRLSAAFDLLHKLVTGSAALATLLKLLLG